MSRGKTVVLVAVTLLASVGVFVLVERQRDETAPMTCTLCRELELRVAQLEGIVANAPAGSREIAPDLDAMDPAFDAAIERQVRKSFEEWIVTNGEAQTELANLAASLTTPYSGRPELEFAQEAWAAAAQDDQGTRYLMLDDLLAKQPLVGRTRKEVEALLGPLIPPTEHPVGVWCYYLGPEDHLLALDSVWLELEFDPSDRVVRTGTFTD